ncbi:hypothetical protein MKW98_010430 [Papaver atlanticum]|uniref:mannan endo-1,4-beta-mannosidase n=1 Tax=Papaver atlanticum TaxID=357466 RepID=A0AAD4TAU2_9MAGN|nr:hypothetical protein MKW98_010430 [Papaver atlanticum]
MSKFSRVVFFFFFSILVILQASEAARLVPSPRVSGFVTTKDTQFLLNGSPFLFNGFNSYWMMHVAADPTERYKISNVFRDASAAGLTVCRTWAFSDGSNQALDLQTSPGVYDERVFQALDFYAQWAKSAGVQISSDDDFYTNPVLKEYYKNHVKRVLTRFNTITKVVYKDDPTIMAWELMNEPRCQADSTGKTVQGWVQEMATYTKSIDNKHLLEIGMEGFYGDSMPEKKQNNPGYQVGTDFISNNLIEEIDFATIHAYPDIWLSGQNDYAQLGFVQKWMSSHWENSRTILKKPLVFSEFGKSSKDPGYTLSARDEYLNAVYDSTDNLARSGGTIGGGLVWQIVAEGMKSFYDGYEIVLSQNPSTAGLISGQSQKMRALSHTLSRKH